MRTIISGALRLLMVTAVLSLSAGCGGGGEESAAAATTTKAQNNQNSKAPSSQTKTASGRTDAVPAGYIPYRCGACGCRVFMGEGPNCTRPGCRHHWSDHQQKMN